MVSTRRSQGDKSQTYSAGDKVEIVRASGVIIFGTLLYKASGSAGRDSPSNRSSTRWMVSVEGVPDEESVSEKQLGRIVSAVDKPGTSKPSKHVVKSTRDDESVVTAAGRGTSQQKAGKGAKKTIKKPVAPKAVKKPIQTKQTNQRKRHIGTRASARQKGNDAVLQDGIQTTRRPQPKPKRSAKKSDETVVKVKMLTGTLFLYRGLNPRAEFVRVR